MQLSRPAPRVRQAAALVLMAGLALFVLAEPTLAKSSLGIGTAEATGVPSGPLAGLFVEINRYQREFFTALRHALVGMRSGSGGVVFLVLLSFAYGVFHAAGPGHGKAVISSYVLANEVQLRRGIFLSFVSALLQALTAILVVGLGWFVLRGTAVSMTDATNVLEIASYALIAAFGGWLLCRKLFRIATRHGLRAWARPAALAGAGGLAFADPAARASASVPGASGVASLKPASGLRWQAPLSGAGSPGMAEGVGIAARPLMRPASGGFAADVCTDDEAACDCGRAHMPDPARLGGTSFSFGIAVSAVLAVGLRPCTGAIVVLTFALMNGLYLGGILSVLAMALGTAITVSAIAVVAVFAKDVALRFGAAGGVRRGVLDAVELLGAVLVLVLGLLLLGSALT